LSPGRCGCAVLACYPFALGACSGAQSALDPAGKEAAEVATLFWTMAAGGLAIWLVVVGLLLYAVRRGTPALSEADAGRLIFWCGAVLSPVVLILLLGFALWLMPALRPWNPTTAGSALHIEVTGKQFWWRVVYRLPDGSSVISANEIQLPVGQRVELALKSADVIHSFWIPPLAGKMDMIPGRINRLSLEANKPGTYRGACAEYCGTSHAFMALSAVVMPPDEFRIWLTGQAVPAETVNGEGADLFMKNGCGACHRIDGTAAQGAIGPDLSHIGSRQTVGAGILPNTRETIARFIIEPDVIKPGSKMPAFGMLPPGEIRAIANYLKGLR
jgi:cytochrome c oxidase subunit 2